MGAGVTEDFLSQPARCALRCERPPCIAALHNKAPGWLIEFYEAYIAADEKRLDAILHDDVYWLLSGPADHIDMFGLRRGKAAAIEFVTKIIPCYFQIVGFEIEQVLVQGENAATCGRVCSVQRETRRANRFGYAHFLRFKDGKLLSMRAVADSFDAMEQLRGCQIEVTGQTSLVPDCDVMAV